MALDTCLENLRSTVSVSFQDAVERAPVCVQ